MKKLFLITLTILTTWHASPAGMPVIDLANLAQALVQVLLASNQVYQAGQLLNRLGDPGAVLQLAGAKQTTDEEQQPGVGKSLSKIQNDTTGESGKSYDGNGLYQPVESSVPIAGDQTLPRPTEAYRKHEALQKSLADYAAVVADTQARLDILRDAQLKTTQQLKGATTDAEVQKLKGIQTSQQSELARLAAERSEAAARVEVQRVANEADKARQEQAADELRTASVQSALTDSLRFFKADTTPLTIPNPRTITP